MAAADWGWGVIEFWFGPAVWVVVGVALWRYGLFCALPGPPACFVSAAWCVSRVTQYVSSSWVNSHEYALDVFLGLTFGVFIGVWLLLVPRLLEGRPRGWGGYEDDEAGEES